MSPNTCTVQTTGSGVVLVPADNGPVGYLADLDEVIARSCDAWEQGYAAGWHDRGADLAANAAHADLCADLATLQAGPKLTDMSGTSEELRQRAQERQETHTARVRARSRKDGAA